MLPNKIAPVVVCIYRKVGADLRLWSIHQIQWRFRANSDLVANRCGLHLRRYVLMFLKMGNYFRKIIFLKEFE